MLKAQIRECTDCGNIQSLLRELDCTIAQLGRSHWLNISFDACNFYNNHQMQVLLHYKRILTYKLFNPDWGCSVELASIISRVKVLLIRKDCCSMSEVCEFPTAETFDEIYES